MPKSILDAIVGRYSYRISSASSTVIINTSTNKAETFDISVLYS